MLYSPAQSPLVVTSSNVNVKSEPQASVAVACSKLGVSGQFIVESAGNVSITGAVLSSIVNFAE